MSPRGNIQKNEDLFESLTKNVFVCILYKTCAGVNIGPMGQTLKKHSSGDTGIQIESLTIQVRIPANSDDEIRPIRNPSDSKSNINIVSTIAILIYF